MEKEKTYGVTLNWSSIVEAKNEEEAKEEVRKVFDSTFLKLDVKELNEETELKIKFKENLSDSSIKLIQKVLKESLGFETVVEELN